MEKYKVVRKYLIDTGEYWEQRAEPDEIENFSAETERDAVIYFRHKYKTDIRLCTKAHNIKKEINVYELQMYYEHRKGTKHIDSEMICT